MLPGFELTAGDVERLANRRVRILMVEPFAGLAIDCDDPTRYRQVNPRVEGRSCMLVPELYHDVAGGHTIARDGLQLGGTSPNVLVQRRGVLGTANCDLQWMFHRLLSFNLRARSGTFP